MGAILLASRNTEDRYMLPSKLELTLLLRHNGHVVEPKPQRPLETIIPSPRIYYNYDIAFTLFQSP